MKLGYVDHGISLLMKIRSIYVYKKCWNVSEKLLIKTRKLHMQNVYTMGTAKWCATWCHWMCVSWRMSKWRQFLNNQVKMHVIWIGHHRHENLNRPYLMSAFGDILWCCAFEFLQCSFVPCCVTYQHSHWNVVYISEKVDNWFICTVMYWNVLMHL